MKGPAGSIKAAPIAAALWALVLQLMVATPAVSAGQAGWSAVKNGTAFIIMRHALAPGTGDPANFAVDDCATQRNLSDKGRRQAQRIGDLFRKAGIKQAEVWSSVWCRCTETAKLLRLGEVRALPALNSFFSNRDQREPQTAALKDWLKARTSSGPLVLVTHQVNITALTGVYPASGEMVFVRTSPDGSVSVVGRIGTGG